MKEPGRRLPALGGTDLKTADRFVVRIVAFAAVLVAFAAFAFGNQSAPAATPVSYAPGSLIIPMDTDTTLNHWAYNQDQGMWKAFGLVNRLLSNGIPVGWAIDTTKTRTSTVDFTADNVKDVRTNTALGGWAYRGGPFVIEAAKATAAKALISPGGPRTPTSPTSTKQTPPSPRILRSSCALRRGSPRTSRTPASPSITSTLPESLISTAMPGPTIHPPTCSTEEEIANGGSVHPGRLSREALRHLRNAS